MLKEYLGHSTTNSWDDSLLLTIVLQKRILFWNIVYKLQARPLLSQALENGNFNGLLDPRLESNYNPDEMIRMTACAATCVRHSARLRPRMSQVSLLNMKICLRITVSVLYLNCFGHLSLTKVCRKMPPWETFVLSLRKKNSPVFC